MLGVTPGSTIYKNQGLLLEEALKPSETATLEAQRQEILDNVTPEIFAKIDWGKMGAPTQAFFGG